MNNIIVINMNIILSFCVVVMVMGDRIGSDGCMGRIGNMVSRLGPKFPPSKADRTIWRESQTLPLTDDIKKSTATLRQHSKLQDE